MATIFLKLLNMSIAASWLILAVVILRLVLKKAPKAIICALWLIVSIRLICPFSMESAFSLIPSTETIPQALISSNTFDVQTGFEAIDTPVNAYLGDHYFEGLSAPEDSGSKLMKLLGSAWAVGVAAMLVYAAVSYLRIKKNVREGTPLRDNIWLCDHIDTPFILGVLRQRIYLPSAMEDTQRHYVIAHENAHLKRRDHWWKPLGFLLLAVYWFNPLCWLAYVLLCRDIEMACDENVVRNWDAHGKKAYSDALLSCSVPRRMVAACPLAFGEVGVKERVKSVLSYRKPAFWIIAVAVVVCIIVAVCFLTNPVDDEQDLSFINYENLAAPAAQSDTLPAVLSGESGTYEYSVQGDALAQFLVSAHWTRQSGILRSVQRDAEKSKESVQIEISDGLFLRVFDSDTAYIYNSTTGKGRYYRMGNGDYSTVFGLISNTGQAPVLSLNDVIMLSEKGNDLTWSDFDGYSYIETGSGLYIRVYTINSQYSLWIGGGPTDELPMYIRLVSEVNSDEYVDIRTESVTDFIEAHRLDMLESAVSNAILEYNRGQYAQGDFACEAHVTLGSTSGQDAQGVFVTAYAVARYQVYNLEGRDFRHADGQVVPAAITFDVTDGSTYSLREYWTPGDGAYYELDLRDKFPENIVEDAIAGYKYSDALGEQCDSQVQNYLSAGSASVSPLSIVSSGEFVTPCQNSL